MSSTTFVDGLTTIVASWANDVNTSVYTTVPGHTTTLAANTAAILTKLTISNNLSDLASASSARTNLGLGTAAIAAATSFAGSGANSNITSLTGLTTPLSVAQGGFGANTHTLNSLLLGNGTSALLEVAPSTSGNILTSNGTAWTSAVPVLAGFGYGQTWQNMIGSRAFGTTYTNSTGKPIQLAVNAGGGTSANVAFNINSTGNVQFAQTSGGWGQCYCIVPNGHTYAINSIAGSNTLGAWYELR